MKNIKNNRVFYKLISSTEEYKTHLTEKGEGNWDKVADTKTEVDWVHEYYVSEVFNLMEDVIKVFDIYRQKNIMLSKDLISSFRHALDHLRAYISIDDLYYIREYNTANNHITKLRDYVKKFYLGLGMDTSKFTPPPINPSNIIDNQR